MRVLIVCLLLMQGLALKDCAPFPQNGNADKTKPTSKSKEKSKPESPGLVKQAAVISPNGPSWDKKLHAAKEILSPRNAVILAQHNIAELYGNDFITIKEQLAEDGEIIGSPRIMAGLRLQDFFNKLQRNLDPGTIKYLARYGYATQDYADSDPTEDNMEGFLTNFQQFAHIPVTGRLDAATLKQMEEARCGMKDPKLKIKVKRTKRYTLYGTSWNDQLKEDRTLTWKVINSGRSFDVDTVRRIMSFALQKWSKVTNINFREETSGDADILVSFRSGPHDDFWPFDGRGGTLAHAFYPYPGAASSGDIHFDDDEEFTYGKSYGTDVLWVAVHEAGHSLGLEHSQVLDAVMYPWYRGSTGKDFDLRPDDIEGIRQLYGDRPVPTTVATKKPTTEATTPEPVTTAAPTTTGSTEPVRPPLPTTEATTPEPVTTAAPTTTGSTEPVRPPLPTTEATTPEPVTTAAPTTTGSTEPVRPPLPTTEATTPEPVTTAAPTTTGSTEPVRPPLPTTEATTPEPVTTAAPTTTGSTEPVRPPLPTTEATTPEPVTTAAPTTTGSTEPVRPPLPTSEATTPEPVTTAAPTTTGSTEPVRPPLPTSEATTPEPVTTAAPTTTGSTEPVRPPLPTSETITPEPVTTAASTTASGTDPVQPPLPTTEATTPEPVTTAAPQTVPIKTSSPVTGSPRSCPVTVDAAVLLRVGWLLIFSGDSFYLVSERGKEYGPIRVQEYFHGLKGKVTAAYKRNDDSVVLFVGNKYYVYYQFRLIEDAQPVTRYGLPADTVVEGALLWPGNRRSNWVQGDKVYLFAGKIYYRYDTRLKSIDRTYPRVISKLWRGLPDTISAAFSGNLYHNWKTHFFSNNQFYLYNDRIVNPYDGYPASLKLFLKC